jgi:hypothetical protein
MIQFRTFVLLLFVIPLFSSCYYDNLEELHPNLSSANCDTTGTISYASDIVPILNAYCSLNNSSCHNSSASYPLNTYANVHTEAFATNGSCSRMLVLTIKHDPCLNPSIQFMPQGGGMLDNCSIQKIEAWVNRGAPNN